MTSTRLAAAGVGLAILLPAILWGGPIAVSVLVGLFGLIALDEYARMAFPADHWLAFGWLALVTGALYGCALGGGPALAAAAYAVGTLATMAFVALRPGASLDGAADRAGRYLLGFTWVGLLGTVALLRWHDHGVMWVFVALTIPWAGDTGAYFAGRAFGRHKMAPRVSPKKTWEGFAGGILTSIVGVLIVRAVEGQTLGVVESVLLGGLLSASAVVGDLSESALKRAFGVKDSGWIMPGHGGILDRVDSLLFVAPLLYVYVTLRP